MSLKRRGLLLDLSGRVLHEVPHFTRAGNPGAPGLWVEIDGGIFRLNLDAGALVPVPRKSAESKMYDEGREPRLPIPAEAVVVQGQVVGHWRYAIPSPSGDVLAQWSGECEVPTAYWIQPGSAPRVITGEYDGAAVPDSIPLGWGADGIAFAWVGRTACGSTGAPPGIYAFSSPGEGELFYRLPDDAHVEMWVR